MIRTFRILTLGVASLVLGCGSPTSASVASDASGSWVRVEEHPGSNFEMSLVANGTTLSGTGNFVAEAGAGGTMTIDSAVSGDTVNLHFTFSTEFTGGSVTSTDHFTGGLIFGELRGTTTYFGPAADISFAPTVFVRKH